MLSIVDVSKEYITGDLHQKALDHVSLNLRDNEFVAVLGPSGSGKTTLLNVIGGLDRYDSGDLIIKGISTKKYKSRDWDSYRNHTVGFVFQSYNLIAHQSILANVELALTISGISRGERRKRAKEALEQVGLGDQVHKKPNQLSGGQMQRVAIARALVNDPSILLADEPTGALDSETSISVMALLKEVAKQRLVVMVTHNPELAETYATRIVKLRDGKITEDSDPFEDEQEKETPVHKNMGKASMSFLTALSLSFANLRAKKARTILTSFAGSIGIIGIALILSLSNGVNTYITDAQKSTMTSYPITIDANAMDLSSLIEARTAGREKRKDLDHGVDGVYVNNSSFERASQMRMSVKHNNLTKFKEFLEEETNEIHQYVGENGIRYSYFVPFSVYSYDPSEELINIDGSNLREEQNRRNRSTRSWMGGLVETPGVDNMEEILTGPNGDLVSNTVKDSYELIYGEWPKAYDELVLVLDANNELSAVRLYELGLLPRQEYRDIRKKLENSEELHLETQKLDYEAILSHTYYLVAACDQYIKGESGFYHAPSEEEPDFNQVLTRAIPLHITGIVKLPEDADIRPIGEPLGYTRALTEYLIRYAGESAIVKEQMASSDRSVINGARFASSDDAEKIADARNWLSRLSTQEKADIFREIMTYYSAGNPDMGKQMVDMTDTEIATMLDQFLLSDQADSDEQLLAIYDNYISVGTWEENMKGFGYVDLNSPTSISIYADSFSAKEGITDAIDRYNETVQEEDQIVYTDYIGLLLSSVTSMVNVISYVLIAFVAVSLIVSSIMIGIITYISVLERTKEIGILRAIGASKRNISQVFNAETFIIGLLSGLIGIITTLLLLIPGNMIIKSLVDVSGVRASLPIASAFILIGLSIVLTLIGGFIPSKKAAKKDPVAALRTE